MTTAMQAHVRLDRKTGASCVRYHPKGASRPPVDPVVAVLRGPGFVRGDVRHLLDWGA